MRNDIVSSRVTAERIATDGKSFSEVNRYASLADCGYCPECHYFKYLKDGICDQCRKDKK